MTAILELHILRAHSVPLEAFLNIGRPPAPTGAINRRAREPCSRCAGDRCQTVVLPAAGNQIFPRLSAVPRIEPGAASPRFRFLEPHV